MSKQSVIKPESVIPVYTQNNVIAGCTTHGSASLQAHQINECHTQKQHHMNEHLAGGAGAGGAGAEGAKAGTLGFTTIHPPQELSPSISNKANSTSNIKAAGGNLLNVHNNRQQTCGPDGEYCKNLGEATQNQNQNQSGGTKTKKNKKRKNKKSVKKNRKLKGILKKKKERKTKTKTRSKNTKRTKKNKKRKTKKVRFSKN